MQRCEIRMIHDGIGNELCVAGHELDDVRWQASFQQNFVENAAGIDIAWGGFPDNNVACYSRSRYKIAANGCEIERRYCIDKSFERTVVVAANFVSFFCRKELSGDSRMMSRGT